MPYYEVNVLDILIDVNGSIEYAKQTNKQKQQCSIKSLHFPNHFI